MSDGIQAISCGDCGKVLEEYEMLSASERSPCPDCGSMKRHVEVKFSASVTASVGMRAKGKAPGVKKPFVEVRAEPSLKRSTGEEVFHERTIDRRQNRYIEKVTLKETGEVLHECDEKLTDHTGHGSANNSKT
jgi:DNA-directed RNA polymerase subunit RPC12/RpoP